MHLRSVKRGYLFIQRISSSIKIGERFLFDVLQKDEKGLVRSVKAEELELWEIHM